MGVRVGVGNFFFETDLSVMGVRVGVANTDLSVMGVRVGVDLSVMGVRVGVANLARYGR